MSKKIISDTSVLHFQMSINNIFVTITDINGNTLDWLTSGKLRFKGRQKVSSAAIYSISWAVIKCLYAKKTKFLHIIFKGNARYRYILLKTLKTNSSLRILTLEDKTPVPHGGCRLSKQRRR